jgi:hypothetical protein
MRLWSLRAAESASRKPALCQRVRQAQNTRVSAIWTGGSKCANHCSGVLTRRIDLFAAAPSERAGTKSRPPRCRRATRQAAFPCWICPDAWTVTRRADGLRARLDLETKEFRNLRFEQVKSKQPKRAKPLSCSKKRFLNLRMRASPIRRSRKRTTHCWETSVKNDRISASS